MDSVFTNSELLMRFHHLGFIILSPALAVIPTMFFLYLSMEERENGIFSFSASLAFSLDNSGQKWLICPRARYCQYPIRKPLAGSLLSAPCFKNRVYNMVWMTHSAHVFHRVFSLFEFLLALSFAHCSRNIVPARIGWLDIARFEVLFSQSSVHGPAGPHNI